MSLLRLARKPPITVGIDATVMEAITVMVEGQVGAVTVTENKKLKGIFTERDVMKKVVHAGLDAKTTKVRDIMTAEVTTVTDEMDVSEAMTIMSERRIRHLPVLNEQGEIEGMISLRYLHHDRMEDLFSELSSLNAYFTADGPGG